MKTIIAGSRTHHPTVEEISCELEWEVDEVVCGMARGADMGGYTWGQFAGVPIKKFPALWDKYGKSAGIRRNTQMALYADALLAFWDGKSRGTKHMISEAKRCGLKIKVVRI